MSTLTPTTVTTTATTTTPSATTTTATTGTSTTGTAAATTSSTGSSTKATLNSDFETFLKMLTVQAENQDPLNPIDSSEYAAQLAAFSSVEQQVQTNDLLKGLATQFGGLGMAQMAHWVGMEARVEAPANFTGTPVEIIPTFESLADKATLVVKDKDGTVVQSLSVDPTKDTLSWAGVGSDGTPFANGQYSFSIESYSAGKLLKSNPAQVYAKIEEIQNQSGTIKLVLEGGSQIDTSDVTALRDG